MTCRDMILRVAPSGPTITADARDQSGAPGRAWLASALALTVALALPFFCIDVPPVLDYPNHLARYFVLAHPDDPILSRMYAPNWRVLPNLGMDVIGAALLRVTDVHTGGRLLLALSLFAPILGVVAYHRAAFGRFHYWPLASGVAAYNGVFFMGFMNFLLSLGLAFAGAALWITLRRRGFQLVAVLAGAIAAPLIFFCSIFGVLLFALLIFAEETTPLVKARLAGALRGTDIARAGMLVALALAPAVALFLASPLSGGPMYVGHWEGFSKPWAAFAAFMTYHSGLTLLTGAVVAGFLVLSRRGVSVARAVPLTLAILAVAFVLAPKTLKGGAFIDIRMSLMMALLLFAGVLPRLTPRRAMLAGAVFAALIGIRVAEVATTWRDHRGDLADVRAAIDGVKPGGAVLVARSRPGMAAHGPEGSRVLPGVYRLDGHLPALLVIERRAFWPTMFAHPLQQPLTPRSPYDRIAQPLGDPVTWELLRREQQSARDLLMARYLAQWRESFDYVLLIDQIMPLEPPRDLTALYIGPYAVLYQVDPPDNN